MFERLQERQEGNRRYWVRIGAAVSIGLTVVTLLVRWSLDQNAERRAESRRAAAAPLPVEADRFERVKLPGMSLEAPFDGAHSGDYRAGKMSSSYPISFGVSWAVGAPITDADAETSLREAMTKIESQPGITSTLDIVGSTHVQLGGAPAIQHRVKEHGGRFLLTKTVGSCGGRVVAITVMGERDVDDTMRRMVASFRCTPDPQAEMFRAEVVVAPRPGWGRLDRERLILASDAGVELQTALLPYAEGSVADQLRKELAGLSSRLTPQAGTRGDKVFWTGVDSKGLPIAALGWRCMQSNQVAVILVQAPKGISLDDGIALAETGKCLGADEKMPEYPVVK